MWLAPECLSIDDGYVATGIKRLALQLLEVSAVLAYTTTSSSLLIQVFSLFPMTYKYLLNQAVVVNGTWPQSFTIQPDLTRGGINVQYQNGTVIGRSSSVLAIDFRG
jgi:hypothetical protein